MAISQFYSTDRSVLFRLLAEMCCDHTAKSHPKHTQFSVHSAWQTRAFAPFSLLFLFGESVFWPNSLGFNVICRYSFNKHIIRKYSTAKLICCVYARARNKQHHWHHVIWNCQILSIHCNIVVFLFCHNVIVDRYNWFIIDISLIIHTHICITYTCTHKHTVTTKSQVPHIANGINQMNGSVW